MSDYFGGRTVFKDRSTLAFDFIPEQLPHRDDILQKLGRVFGGVLDGSSAQQVLIRGPVGSGKTVIARRFGRLLHDEMHGRGVSLRVAYVNCRNERTDALVLTKILQGLDKGFPDRGFSVAEMQNALAKQLTKGQTRLLVILDEIDVLLRQGPELVYRLSRFEVDGGSNPVSLIAVSQQDIVPLLDEATASTFKQANTIRLDGYEKDAMDAIVAQRVDLAFHTGTMADDVADLVSDIGAAKGDARLSIELLDAAGTNADDRGADSVTAEDVRVAKANKYSELPEHKLRELPLHESLTLLAIARRLSRTEAAFAITGEVEETYQLVAEEYGESARGHTQFWSYLKNLAGYGFIDLKKSGKGQAGTTQLISLPDVPAAEFKERLVALLVEEHGKTA